MIPLLFIAVLAFLSEFMDSSLGMGYGTTLTPVLLILKFKPLDIVPAVLLSQFITSLSAGFLHHQFGNVDFRRGSLHLKVALALSVSGIIGSVIAVFIAINISRFTLSVYIGLMVLLIGVIMLVNRNRNYDFSWKKIYGLGILAAFNKGLTGGGYGPVVMGGQILSGMDAKNAVGITSLAEGITCAVGFLIYFFTGGIGSWTLMPYVLAGALISVPFSTFVVKIINTRTLRFAVANMTLALGILTLLRIR